MIGPNGVRLERCGALALLLVSSVGAWWLSRHTAVVESSTSARAEQLDHLVTLVERHAAPGASAVAPLENLDGLFQGQRLVWTASPVGPVLSLRVLAEGDKP